VGYENLKVKSLPSPQLSSDYLCFAAWEAAQQTGALSPGIAV
jgi:hypothetical protein